MISYYYWPKGSIHIPRPGEIRQASLTGEKGGIVGGSRFFAGKGAWIRRVEGLEGMSTRIGEDGGRGRSRVLQNASPPTRALESAAPPETPLPPDLPHLPRETLPGAASGAGSVYGGVIWKRGSHPLCVGSAPTALAFSRPVDKGDAIPFSILPCGMG